MCVLCWLSCSWPMPYLHVLFCTLGNRFLNGKITLNETKLCSFLHAAHLYLCSLNASFGREPIHFHYTVIYLAIVRPTVCAFSSIVFLNVHSTCSEFVCWGLFCWSRIRISSNCCSLYFCVYTFPVETMPTKGTTLANTNSATPTQHDLLDLVSVPAEFSRILLIRRPQAQLVANLRLQLRCTTFNKFTVAALTQSHDLRRWARQSTTHTRRKNQRTPLATRHRTQEPQGYDNADSTTMWHVSFQNYPIVSSTESPTTQLSILFSTWNVSSTEVLARRLIGTCAGRPQITKYFTDLVLKTLSYSVC